MAPEFPITEQVRDTVRDYMARGWNCVPIAPGEKRPTSNDWLERNFDPTDFTSPTNIGVKLGAKSNWLVDIDCDTLASASVARRNLGNFTLSSGRAGRPWSHYWYNCPDAKPEQFTDLNGKVLVEIRSSQQQTVLPPSIHPSGERIEWHNATCPVGSASADQIRRIAIDIAATCLLAEAWPTGSRHFAAAALGGFLVRLGYDKFQIGDMVRAVCELAQDEETEDRVRAAQETADKMENPNAPTTGAPKLAELLINGKEVVQKIREWFGAGNDELLEKMNERFFVVQIGKDVVVGIENSDKPEFMSFDNFNKLFYNVTVGKKKAGQWWLEHPKRRTHDRVVMMPPGAPGKLNPNDYNLWRGFAYEPMTDQRPERFIQRYLHHTRVVIANEDETLAEFILDLLADAVQRPGDPVGRALALRGTQGAGKSVFVEHFGKLFGPSGFISVSSREQLIGKFNAHLAGKIVVFADEAVWGGNRQDVGILKHMTTQNTINIQPKGIDILSMPNYLHLFLATNESWAWPAGNNERRGVLVDVKEGMTAEYFNSLWEEVLAPEFGPALLAYLLARQIDYPRLRGLRVNTEAMQEQQALGADPVQHWWEMILEEGTLGPKVGWPKFVTTDVLYDKYVNDMGSARGAGQSFRGSKMAFMRKLLMFFPHRTVPYVRRLRMNVTPAFEGPPVIQSVVVRCVDLPELSWCRKRYDDMTGYPRNWSDAGHEQNQDLIETEVVDEPHGI